MDEEFEYLGDPMCTNAPNKKHFQAIISQKQSLTTGQQNKHIWMHNLSHNLTYLDCWHFSSASVKCPPRPFTSLSVRCATCSGAASLKTSPIENINLTVSILVHVKLFIMLTCACQIFHNALLAKCAIKNFTNPSNSWVQAIKHKYRTLPFQTALQKKIQPREFWCILKDSCAMQHGHSYHGVVYLCLNLMLNSYFMLKFLQHVMYNITLLSFLFVFLPDQK